MNMRIILLLIAGLINHAAYAQRPIKSTDSLFITGKVKNPTTFTLADLDTFPKVQIKAPITYNQQGGPRDSLTGMLGIPFKTLLQSVEFDSEGSKYLNEFYFVFTASDGYRVVFSWNEVYTSEAANSFFIVTEIDGKKLKDMEQRIYFISNADSKRGNRRIKGLKTIELRRID
jgi:hypothetical protein